MSDSLHVAVVEALEELFEVISGQILLEPSRYGDEVEQLTAESELQHDVRHSLVRAAWLGVDSLAVFDLLNDVVVLQLAHGLDLGHHKLCHLWVHVITDNLDSNQSLGLGVLRKLNLAAGTFAQGFDDLVSSKSFTHFLEVI